jgi:hypothetical protein
MLAQHLPRKRGRKETPLLLNSQPVWEGLMSDISIFAPMAALIALTFLVLLLIPIKRFRSGFAGETTGEDFRFGESVRVPGHVSIPNRNYMNLLELPMLFYVCCLSL